jgi:hypothetical protein
VAVLGVVSRWIGVLLAVFFLVVFLGGSVGALVIAAAWLLAARALRAGPNRRGRPAEALSPVARP